MLVTVDRIEDGMAVLELPGRFMMELAASELPQGCKGGDVLQMDADGRLSPEEAETEKRRRANIDLFNSLLED